MTGVYRFGTITTNPRIMRKPETQMEWVQVMKELDTFMNLKDYNLEVLRGNVPGHAMVAVSGHQDAATTTRITVHPGSATKALDQSAIAATPALVEVASTSAADALSGPGTGAHTVRVTGLNSSGVIATEDVDLTGQTEASTVATFSAVTGLRITAVGSGKKNAGTIWCGTGTWTSQIPAVALFSMEAGENKGLTAYYTVPAAKTLYLRALTMTSLAGTKKEADIYVETSSDGLFWVTEQEFGIESGTEFQAAIEAAPGLPAGAHLRIESHATAATDLATILTCELVDN